MPIGRSITGSRPRSTTATPTTTGSSCRSTISRRRRSWTGISTASAFRDNPVGVTYDPEEMCRRYEAGEPMPDLSEHPAAARGQDALGHAGEPLIASGRRRAPPAGVCQRRSPLHREQLVVAGRSQWRVAAPYPTPNEGAEIRMSAGPQRRDLWDNPMGTDGFEFVEYTGPDPQALAALFERMGFVAAARHRSKNVTLYQQGDVNFIVNAEPESFAQAFARLHGPSVCAIAFRVADAAKAYQRAISIGRQAGARQGRADGAQHPGDRRDRRQPDLSGRPLWRRAPSTTSISCRCSTTAAPAGVGPDRDRPSDPQRPPRPHGAMGRVLRAALQLPRDPLFRHRRQADRAALEGDDQPGRQDPHPDQRERRRQVADRRISRGLSRRGHPAHRAGTDDIYATVEALRARGVSFMSVPGHLLRGGRCAPAGPWRGPRRGCSATAS